MINHSDSKTVQNTSYIKESQEIKDKIEHDLKSSFFTKLARGQQQIKGSIDKCKMVSKHFEMSIQDGEKIKHSFFGVQAQQEEALMKVLNDINSEQVVSQLRYFHLLMHPHYLLINGNKEAILNCYCTERKDEERNLNSRSQRMKLMPTNK